MVSNTNDQGPQGYTDFVRLALMGASLVILLAL